MLYMKDGSVLFCERNGGINIKTRINNKVKRVPRVLLVAS